MADLLGITISELDTFADTRLRARRARSARATSPQLANLVLFSLDRRLAALAESAWACYTR